MFNLILRSLDFDKPFILQTDASDRGVEAVLSQKGEDNEEHLLGYFSRSYCRWRRNTQLLKRSVWQLSWELVHFVYILGKIFTIQTDHRSLEWLDQNNNCKSVISTTSLKGLENSYFTITVLNDKNKIP